MTRSRTTIATATAVGLWSLAAVARAQGGSVDHSVTTVTALFLLLGLPLSIAVVKLVEFHRRPRYLDEPSGQEWIDVSGVLLEIDPALRDRMTHAIAKRSLARRWKASLELLLAVPDQWRVVAVFDPPTLRRSAIEGQLAEMRTAMRAYRGNRDQLVLRVASKGLLESGLRSPEAVRGRLEAWREAHARDLLVVDVEWVEPARGYRDG